jgi:hypothetical protein
VTQAPTQAFHDVELVEITRKMDLVVSAMEKLCKKYDIVFNDLTKE